MILGGNGRYHVTMGQLSLLETCTAARNTKRVACGGLRQPVEGVRKRPFAADITNGGLGPRATWHLLLRLRSRHLPPQSKWARSGHCAPSLGIVLLHHEVQKAGDKRPMRTPRPSGPFLLTGVPDPRAAGSIRSTKRVHMAASMRQRVRIIQKSRWAPRSQRIRPQVTRTPELRLASPLSSCALPCRCYLLAENPTFHRNSLAERRGEVTPTR